MSITGLNPDIGRLYGNNNNTFHHRNDSTELDVFEAARYFSGDPATDNNKLSLAGARRRNSLDLPAARNHHHHYYMAADQNHNHNHNQNKKQAPAVVVKDKLRHKQPSSPGGRLATFLNSLFTQSSKNKKPKSAASSPDDDDLPGGGARRRRRSSISHFSFGNSADKNSVSSKSSGGHRSPPEAYPARNDPRGLSGHKQAFSVREITKNPEPSSSWLDLEKFRFRDGLSGDKNNFISDRSDRKDVTCRARVFKDEYDEGAESDSSSDLFELKNYDLGDHSSGLPVYETTKPESVKRRGVPISASGS